MNSANLPLPLELTQPVLLAGDLETQFSEYDPKTQLCSATQSQATCNTVNANGVIDVGADVVIDDVIA